MESICSLAKAAGLELLQSFGDLDKVVAHADAVVRQRAAGIDEGEQQRLSAELREVNGASVLVEEAEVRRRLALLRQVHGRGGGKIGRAAGLGDGDVFQIGVVVDHQGCLHGVTGMDDVEDPGIAHGEAHGHGLHVSGDLVMVERKGVGGGIDGDDAALDGKTALAGGRLLRMAARNENDEAKQQADSEKNANAQGTPPQTV